MRYPPPSSNGRFSNEAQTHVSYYETEYSAAYRVGAQPHASSVSTQPIVAGRVVSRHDEENMRREHSTASGRHEGGYNSDDERYDGSAAGPAVVNAEFRDDMSFVQALKTRRGWFVEPCKEDGACMFRAVAFHLYGDQEMHGTVRDHCMDYMVRNRDHFQEFVTEDFDEYVARKRNDRCYGNHLEMQAMSELYNRNIEVYAYNLDPINTFSSRQNGVAPIRVSYHGNIHYNAIYDPNNPTFGVGLGFAGLRPGEADRSQVALAKSISDTQTTEQELLQSSLRQSEDEMLMQAIENSVIAESRKEFLKAQNLR